MTLMDSPATPRFDRDQACAHCGSPADMCVARQHAALQAFDLAWHAGTHKAQAGYKYETRPEDARREWRARTEHNARCCAGCAMHGFSR